MAACVSDAPEQSAKSLGGPRVPTPAQLDAWVPDDVRWETEGSFAHPLVPGPYKSLPVQVSTFRSFDGTRIQTALWRPDVPEGVKAPVIIDAGPYYGDQIERPLPYIAPTIISGLVPYGFAYAQVAMRGTAGSGGCMEVFSMNEQKDVDAAVTHFATQPWSNGNVALTGISYDGTDTWIAAAFPNPALKTIVPISGLTSIYDHHVRNGTPWLFEPVLHANYWAYGWQTERRTPEDKVANAACPEGVRGVATASYTLVTGDRNEPGPLDGFWDDRDFKPRILKNYEGSVFLVQGLRDWRVPPYLHFPFMQEMQAKGIETKMLLGQWWHDMPDKVQEPQQRRWDYAEMLLRWFQQELMGLDVVNTGPLVDVQDDHGAWRTEENWPPADANWTTLFLGANTLRRQDGAAGDQVLFSPASAHRLVSERVPAARGNPVPVVEYRVALGPLQEDLRVAGLPRLHVTFIPTSPEGARIQAQLLDRDPSGAERDVGHAVMDLRYYKGGYQRHQLTPGQPIQALMEFLPLDAHLQAGHQLVLSISNAGYSEERLNRGGTGVIDQWHESPAPLPVRIAWGGGRSTLELPLIERDVGDGKYPGQP
ncbi:MAG TPA: CocE/NonD family hydrolase [Candidatus Thermoplasmatota archaeon]|nr:CocE/NonD family hydrolase [Candidatus Thermoplasmatota archaeon]